MSIYLDYMATTPVDCQVAETMAHYLTREGVFGNPASQHSYGKAAAQAIQVAREQVAALLNAQPREIIWTSGATEANNLAILGVAQFYRHAGRHIITLTTEHKAVLDPCQQLERAGFEVSYLSPAANGLVDLDQLAHTIRQDTILVSVMHVNNEIGVEQDIQAIGELTRQQGIVFHSDAAQSAGKVPIDVQRMPVDLLSFSAHKVYGPKGMGALYVRRKPRVRLVPLIYGGGQEQGLRSGTLATHQIVGMGAAFQLAQQRLTTDYQYISQLNQRFWQGMAGMTGIQLNGDAERRVPHNINISIADVEGESLVLALRELAISTASACMAATIEPSYVLRALGMPAELAHSSIRLSLGRFTTQDEIDQAVQMLRAQIARLRELADGL